jgi:general secretion pathway protein A
MYTAFYGLREKPFALTPDPRFLFLAHSHREALAHLLYGVDQGEGFVAITGEVGTGKTTLCRSLLERLGSDCEVAFLFDPSYSGQELLQAISVEFGLETGDLSRRELGAQLNRFLLEKKAQQRRVLLIIDEAQNLSARTLEQVRLLSNLETSTSKLIQILLLGQPELDRKLDSRELRQLRQRIGVRCGLQPLSRRETRDYVRHRLRVAARAERDIFSDAALWEIHRRSGGIPRLVNVLCDRCLLAGYAAGEPRVGRGLVKTAAREIPDARLRPAGGSAPWVRRKIGWLAAAAVLFGLVTTGLVVAGGHFSAPGAEALAERTRAILAGDWLGRVGSSDSVTAVSAAPPPGADAVEAGAGVWAAEVCEEGEQALPSAAYGVSISSGERASSGSWPRATQGSAASSADAARVPASGEPAPIPEAGRVLARVLEGRDAADTRLSAINSVLDAFGLPSYGRVPESDEVAVAMLQARGLTVLSLERADFETLGMLNHPALMTLRGELGETRLLALRHLDGHRALLYGATGRGPLRLPLDEVGERWTGRAFVVWQDFESIPDVLALGERGDAVAWLQSALFELGYCRDAASGLFDRSTRDCLQAFQQSRNLRPDGAAGPRTQMVLYDVLGRYQVPRLRDREGSG